MFLHLMQGFQFYITEKKEIYALETLDVSLEITMPEEAWVVIFASRLLDSKSGVNESSP